MAPRVTFIICSVITFLIAAAIYIVPEFFTMKAFLKAKGNEVEIGITMHYLLAGGIFHVCLLLFAASKLDGANNQKPVMLYSAVGFTVSCATMIYATIFRDLGDVIPPITGTGLMAILSWFSWSKIKK